MAAPKPDAPATTPEVATSVLIPAGHTGPLSYTDLSPAPPETKPVADEVKNSNVATVVNEGDWWYAVLGPDRDRGLVGVGRSPEAAFWSLADRVLKGGWVFDPSWKPAGGAALHDA